MKSNLPKATPIIKLSLAGVYQNALNAWKFYIVAGDRRHIKHYLVMRTDCLIVNAHVAYTI